MLGLLVPGVGMGAGGAGASTPVLVVRHSGRRIGVVQPDVGTIGGAGVSG
jgi:hypothetical protein